jgi:hypothetical protein
MELKKFYLYLAPFFILILSAGPVLGLSFFSFLYLILAYLIPAALETPKLREKIFQKKYSLSFLRLLFMIRESSQRLLPLKEDPQKIIGRHIPSLLFVNVIYALSPSGSLAIWFVGVFSFELCFWIYSINTFNADDTDVL